MSQINEKRVNGPRFEWLKTNAGTKQMEGNDLILGDNFVILGAWAALGLGFCCHLTTLDLY